MNYDDNADRIGQRVQTNTRLAIFRTRMTETLSAGSGGLQTCSTGTSNKDKSEQADRTEAV